MSAMRETSSNRGRTAIDRIAAGTLLAVALMLTAHQARAQTAPADAPAAPPAKPAPSPAKAAQPAKAQPVRAAQPAAAASQSVVINLIRLLVQEGVLTQDKANALIRQAEDEAAAAARGQPPVINQPSAAPRLAVGSAPAAPQSVRVPYIP